MDPALRRYLRVFLVLLSALVVATVGLLVVALDSFLPVALVAVFAVVLAEGLHGYVSAVDDDGETTAPEERAGSSRP